MTDGPSNFHTGFANAREIFTQKNSAVKLKSSKKNHFSPVALRTDKTKLNKLASLNNENER